MVAPRVPPAARFDQYNEGELGLDQAAPGRFRQPAGGRPDPGDRSPEGFCQTCPGSGQRTPRSLIVLTTSASVSLAVTRAVLLAACCMRSGTPWLMHR